MRSDSYDIAVIGAGPGGYVAAIRAAQRGAKVALIEKEKVGGVCLHRGCIPTKAIIQSMHFYALMKRGDEFGIQCSDVEINYPKVIARQQELVSKLWKGIETLLKTNRVELITGTAQLKGAGKISVSGPAAREIEAAKIILAVGTVPARPAFARFDNRQVVTSDEALSIEDVPENVAIIGAGSIGMEFAYVYSTLGCQVTVIEMADQVLPSEDPEISQVLQQSLEKRGVNFRLSTKTAHAAQNTVTLESGETIFADLILVATGRQPLTDGFGELGIALEKNAVTVNDKMETTLPGVYAIGDITGKAMLAHVASAQGLVAAANATGRLETISYEAIPNCIYTIPEVAHVGITEKQAKERGIAYEVGKFPFQALGKAHIEGEPEGFVKLLMERSSEKILGLHMIGPSVSNLIAEGVLAIGLGAKASDLEKSIHAHPTLSESVMEAAAALYGQAIHTINRPKISRQGNRI